MGAGSSRGLTRMFTFCIERLGSTSIGDTSISRSDQKRFRNPRRMREFTKSLFSSSLALSLVGARQLAATLAPTCRGPLLPFPHASLESVTQSATSGLSRRFQHYFEIGDSAQRGLVDLANAAVRLDASGLLKPGTDVANAFVESLGPLASNSDLYVDWQELRNKIDIYDLVRNVESRLNAADGASIAELVDRGYALGDFHALWAVEGLGNYYAVQATERFKEPQDILTDPVALRLPDKSLTMMNAGLGLAFAERLLKEYTSQNGSPNADELVHRFIRLCNANATPGYTGCALESLGLVAKTFFPSTIQQIDRAILANDDDSVLGYFWHGVGRGNYFSLSNFLPCGGISWTRLVRQSTHRIGQQSLVAGLAWAMTLVNMRTPNIMEKCLRVRGNQIAKVDAAAFANGVESACVIRLDVSPKAPFIHAFHEAYRDSAKSPVADLWKCWITQPCQTASRVRDEFALLNCLETVFAYRCAVGVSVDTTGAKSEGGVR